MADSKPTTHSPGLNSDDDAGAAEKSEAVLEAAPNPEKAAGAAWRGRRPTERQRGVRMWVGMGRRAEAQMSSMASEAYAKERRTLLAKGRLGCGRGRKGAGSWVGRREKGRQERGQI